LLDFLQAARRLISLEAGRDIQWRATRQRSRKAQGSAQIPNPLQAPPERFPIVANGGHSIDLEHRTIKDGRSRQFIPRAMWRSIRLSEEGLHASLPIGPGERNTRLVPREGPQLLTPADQGIVPIFGLSDGLAHRLDVFQELNPV